MGDGATAQLSAMLTGIAEHEQPEARRDMGPAAKLIDNCMALDISGLHT